MVKVNESVPVSVIISFFDEHTFGINPGAFGLEKKWMMSPGQIILHFFKLRVI